MKHAPVFALAGVLTLLAAQAAEAAPRQMDFDLWCTEEAKIPYQRCAQRLPDDLKKFEAYRKVIEKYDLQEERQKQKNLQLEHSVLDNEHVRQTPDDKAPPPKTDGN